MSELAKIIYLCKDIGISTSCQRELKCILCFQSGEKPQVMQCVNPNVNLCFKVRQHPEAADRSVLIGRIGFFHVNKRVVRAPLGKIWHLFVLVEFHSYFRVERCQSSNAVGGEGRGCHRHHLWILWMIYRSLYSPRRCNNSCFFLFVRDHE